MLYVRGKEMPNFENIDNECSIDFIERALLDIVNYVFLS